MAVQAAAAAVFPVSDVSVLGAKVESGVANQPVGFAAGQRGAEVRLSRIVAVLRAAHWFSEGNGRAQSSGRMVRYDQALWFASEREMFGLH